jgi:hypothetical protein
MSFATLSEFMSERELYRVSAVFAPGEFHSFPPAVAKPGARTLEASVGGGFGFSTTAVFIGPCEASSAKGLCIGSARDVKQISRIKDCLELGIEYFPAYIARASSARRA